jgi:hypothetical protein
MSTIAPIEYTKFTVEVFAPDGTFIKNAEINQVNNFMVAGLTPGNKYIIAISYDDILLLCASFNCDVTGKVVYLSPAHFIFNNGAEAIPNKVGNDLATKVKKRARFNIPFQTWEKQLIENILSTGKKNHNIFTGDNNLPCFNVGSDLATKVK